MSAKQTFAFCLDCWELNYGVSDRNGVYTRDSESSNHFDCAVHVFGSPSDYVPPIRGVMTIHVKLSGMDSQPATEPSVAQGGPVVDEPTLFGALT